MSRAPKWKHFTGWARPSNGSLFHFWTNGRIRCNTGVMNIAHGYHAATEKDMRLSLPCGECLKLTEHDSAKEVEDLESTIHAAAEKFAVAISNPPNQH